MAIFKVGDLVQLKSGSPVMTVESVNEETGDRTVATCVWFDNKKTERQNFNVALLVIYDSSPKTVRLGAPIA